MYQVAATHLSPRVGWQPGQRLQAAILARPGVSDSERHASPRFAELRLSETQVAAKLEVGVPQREFVRGAGPADQPTEPANGAQEEAANLGLRRRGGPAHNPGELTVRLLSGDVPIPGCPWEG